MRTKFNTTSTAARTVRWAIMTCCLCFLGVSILAPVSAAVMANNNFTPSTTHTSNHSSMGDHSMTMNQHHHTGVASACDKTPCNHNSGCMGTCIHCNVCSFSAAPTSTLAPFGEYRPLSTDSHRGPPNGLPAHRSNPPYRPPISLN